MTATTDANDVLFGSNSPSAKFGDQPGTTIGGIIAAPPRSKQEHEWNHATQRSDGPPKFFPSGDPIMDVLVDVQTQQRDPNIQNDDGIRTLYLSGKRMKDAVRDAVRQSGAQRLEVGAELYLTFTGLGPAPSPGSNQPKEWAARYVPAASAALGFGQQGQQQPVQQAPQGGYAQPAPQQTYQQPPTQQAYQPPAPQQPVQQYAQPQQQAYVPPAQQQVVPQTVDQAAQVVQQTPPAQAPAGPTPEQIAGLLANRTDPRLVFPGVQLTPEQQAQVASFTQPQG